MERSLLVSKPFVITASQLASLLELLYVLVIDYRENGSKKADNNTATEIKQIAPPIIKDWNEWLPILSPAVKAALTGREKVEYLVALGQEIRDNFQYFRAEHEFTSAELDVLNAIQAFLRTDSEPAYRKLSKLASITGSAWVARMMAPEVKSQSGSAAELSKLVKRLVGRKDTSLTLDEAKIIKETQPEAYKEYLALRRDFNQAWKDALVAFIRQSGQKLVPYQDILDYMDSNGIETTLARGFTGLIDDQGKLYTKEKEPIDGVPNAVTFPNIVMNPKYGPNSPWVFRADKADGSQGPYFYTSEFKREQAKKKFSKVEDLSGKIEGIRKKWFAQIRKFDIESPQSVAAVILELLYEFSARIGSAGNAAGGSSTYGIATLLAKHIKELPNGDILIAYKGKDGVSTRHTIKKTDQEQKFLIKPILELLEGKQPKERVFTYNKGNRQAIVSPAMVNQYFKQLGAGDVTVHKIRTYHGTKLFKELMDAQMGKTRQPKTEKDALAIYMKMAEAVGKKLNHVRRGASGTKVTGTTAIHNYIDPVASISFFRNLGFRIPKFLEKYDIAG